MLADKNPVETDSRRPLGASREINGPKNAILDNVLRFLFVKDSALGLAIDLSEIIERTGTEAPVTCCKRLCGFTASLENQLVLQNWRG